MIEISFIKTVSFKKPFVNTIKRNYSHYLLYTLFPILTFLLSDVTLFYVFNIIINFFLCIKI